MQRLSCVSLSLILLFAVQSAAALQRDPLLSTTPQDRVTTPVDDAMRVSLPGNTLPQAIPELEIGAAAPTTRLEHILLVLKPDEMQQRTLDALVEAQQDPSSPSYRHWLTPQDYANHFGVSASDIEQIQAWLERYGLTVDEVAVSRRTLSFSGTAAQIQAAFQIQLRTYEFEGKKHIANDADPTIPAAFAGVIGGIASLHDVFSEPQHRKTRVSPEFTSGSSHYLSPADFATIYAVTPLYHQALTGNGQKIAIVGRADISLPDVRAFRAKFGLPAIDPVITINGSNPGSAVTGDVDEAMLDVEWSGAVADGATIEFVTSASTAVSDGVFLSAQYIVDHNLAPIMSMSYGLCEASLGASGNSFINALWEQAASQGITVLVSAGDSGAAGCDASSSTKATHGRGVNGLCATPYSTCVAGTEFDDVANPALYWSATNSSSGSSALEYIPESVWNESGAGGLWSTGGGVSAVYAKPSWQSAPGVPNDGHRDVPDVALTAASHDGYLVQIDGGLYSIAGTSAAAPSFAGLLALVTQKTASRLGNANPELYKLASIKAIPGTVPIFHDITSGNNSVPGVTGYSAGPGYDQTTGLGSVDAQALVAAWGAAPPVTPPAFSISLSASSITIPKGGSATVTITSTIANGFSDPIKLSLGSLPAGLTATFTPTTIAAPGKGTALLKITASATTATATNTLVVTASGGGLTHTASLQETVPGLILTAVPSGTELPRGSSLVIYLETASLGFDTPITLQVAGLPSGVTATFSPASITAPGLGQGKLTLTASKTPTLGSVKAVIKASGGGLSSSSTVTFAVTDATAGIDHNPIQVRGIPIRRIDRY